MSTSGAFLLAGVPAFLAAVFVELVIEFMLAREVRYRGFRYSRVPPGTYWLGASTGAFVALVFALLLPQRRDVEWVFVAVPVAGLVAAVVDLPLCFARNRRAGRPPVWALGEVLAIGATIILLGCAVGVLLLLSLLAPLGNSASWGAPA